MSCDVGEVTESLENDQSFTYVTAHSDSPSFLSLHLRHSSFSNPSLALPTSQLILQPFLFLPMSQLILQPFRCFTYVTAHSQTLLLLLLNHSSAHSPSFQSLHLRHSAFSNSSLAFLPMSQFVLQPFCCFTYVTPHSPTLLSLLLHHRIFTYIHKLQRIYYILK